MRTLCIIHSNVHWHIWEWHCPWTLAFAHHCIHSDLTHEDSDIIQEDLDLIKENSDLLQQDIPDLSQQHHHNCPTNHHYEVARSCAQPKKQKPSHAYSTPWGTTATLPPYLPGTAAGILPFMPSFMSSSNKQTNKKNLFKKPRKKISFQAIIRFAQSGVGKNEKKEAKSSSKRPRHIAIRRKPGATGGPPRRRGIKWPPCPRPILVPEAQITRMNIRPSSQACLRQSFQVLAQDGAIKRPVIHVQFDTPKSLKDCMSCSSKDFLYVYVGLFHVFLLQFIMVVLLFFANEKQEVKLSEFTTFF